MGLVLLSDAGLTCATLTTEAPVAGVWVGLNALQRMVAMGLGPLPVSCVSCLGGKPLTALGSPETLALPQPLGQALPKTWMLALEELHAYLNQRGVKAYCIGGLPRDLLLNPHTPAANQTDLDMTVEGDALALAQGLAKASANFVVTHRYPEFGTATLCYRQLLTIDVASTRAEVYDACGQLPRVLQQGVSLGQDVLRRDFTCNTLALPLHTLAQVLDTLGGYSDIETKTLRLLHGASLFEDPSRLVRAMVFATRLGFTLDATLLHLLAQWVDYADTTGYTGGGDRVKTALMAWLALPASPAKRHTMALWLKLGGLRVLAALPPAILEQASQQALAWLEALEPTLALLQQVWPEPLPPHEEATLFALDEGEFWLSVLVLSIPLAWRDEVANRLALSKQQRKALHHLELWLSDAKGGRSQLEQHLLQGDLSPWALCQQWQALQGAGVALAVLVSPHTASWLGVLTPYAHRWRTMALAPPLLNGDALLALGVPAGVRLGHALQALKNEALKGTVTTIQQAEAYIKAHWG